MATKILAKKAGVEKAVPERVVVLQDLFYGELQDIYWAENHLLKVLPKIIRAAWTEDLKRVISEHLDATQSHVKRLDQVFNMLGERPPAKKCAAMEGLTKEADDIIGYTDGGTAARDVAIIMIVQKVEHYEIAAYGSLEQLACTLELEGIADLLQVTLREEKAMDITLTDIARNSVDYKAAPEQGNMRG